MNRRTERTWRGAVCASAAAVALAACDRDPSRPDVTFPTAQVLVGDSLNLGRQEGIRFLFPGGLLAQTALDPANFVVTNLCTGLRVPGALRLGGDTLVFTPSQALPFLSRIGVRLQNLQAGNGAQLAQPLTATFVTEAPPVSDASWSFLNSPSNDLMTGVDFPGADGLTGYLLSFSGGVYRSADAGGSFAALYKNDNVNTAFGLHAFGPGIAVAAPGIDVTGGADTVFFVGSIRTPDGFRSGLLRSINSGVSFDSVGNTVPEVLLAAHFVREPASPAVIRGVLGGASGTPGAYFYSSATGTVTRATLGAPASTIFSDISLSPDAGAAVVTAFFSSSAAGTPNAGVAFRSTDGGESYTQVALPAATPALRGTGFINATTALLLGDSSRVLRLNVETGAVDSLGEAQGIPQTFVDPLTRQTTLYTFQRARFDAAGQVGYIVGRFRRVRPGSPDEVGGIILRTVNGGTSFTRQAIQGAPENGVRFPAVSDVKVKSSGLALLSGSNGLAASRQPNSPTQIAVCSLTQP